MIDTLQLSYEIFAVRLLISLFWGLWVWGLHVRVPLPALLAACRESLQVRQAKALIQDAKSKLSSFASEAPLQLHP